MAKRLTESEYLSKPMTLWRFLVWLFRWRTKEVLIFIIILLVIGFIFFKVEYNKESGWSLIKPDVKYEGGR